MLESAGSLRAEVASAGLAEGLGQVFQGPGRKGLGGDRPTAAVGLSLQQGEAGQFLHLTHGWGGDDHRLSPADTQEVGNPEAIHGIGLGLAEANLVVGFDLEGVEDRDGVALGGHGLVEG